MWSRLCPYWQTSYGRYVSFVIRSIASDNVCIHIVFNMFKLKLFFLSMSVTAVSAVYVIIYVKRHALIPNGVNANILSMLLYRNNLCDIGMQISSSVIL